MEHTLLIKDKDFKLAKAKKSKLPVDLTEARKIRNFCTKRLRKAKAEFIRDKMEATGGDQKKFWKTIQDIIPNTKKSQNLISLINENTGEVVSENETANFINDFFLNIGPKLAASLDREWDYMGVETEQVIDDIAVMSEHIEKLCEKNQYQQVVGPTQYCNVVTKKCILMYTGYNNNDYKCSI